MCLLLRTPRSRRRPVSVEACRQRTHLRELLLRGMLAPQTMHGRTRRSATFDRAAHAQELPQNRRQLATMVIGVPQFKHSRVSAVPGDSPGTVTA